MDIGRYLQNAGDSAYNTINDLYGGDPFANAPGVKPDDFGLRGAKPNHPMTRMAGMKLARVGLADTIAGEISNKIIQPVAEKAIGAGLTFMKNNPDSILAVRTAF